VRRLVHAPIVDAPVGVLDCGGLDCRELDPVGVAELAEQDPVRLRCVVLPLVGLGDAGRNRHIGDGVGGVRHFVSSRRSCPPADPYCAFITRIQKRPG
jgi:hypothetical protein